MASRVRLRAPRPEDQEELLRLNRASRSFHRGRADPPMTARAFSAYYKRILTPHQVPRLICRKADGMILGTINLSEIVRGNFQSAYLGYYIGAPFARQGYMREALDLMLRHAFGPSRLHRVEANIQPMNKASIELVRKAGFVREGRSRRYLRVGGRWRDHERWAILAEDWRRERRSRSARKRG